jgi:sigma-B regulation protein RsbU (phosphoserine phosphatase)
LHSKVGSVIVNSIVFGAAIAGIVLIVFKFQCDYFLINLTKKDFLNPDFISASMPVFTAFNSAFNSYAVMMIVLIFFISGSIKRFIKDEIAFVIINSLFFSLFFYFGFTPLYLSIFLSFVVGLIISIILVKTDILTTIFSFLIFIFFMKISVFEGNAIYNYKFNEVILYSLLWMSFGFVLIFRRDKEIDYNSLAPKFVENITERQRLKKELEVARIVQAGFLPKKNPALRGIEISSVCIPAFEVGGDYYDFIKINDNKMGIVIGDVSGKGTQASFYMTLTKGFIKAIAKKSDSPSKVLTEMNELFYENVDRGRFISMIYAIIDLEKNEMKIARAGHNPVIVVEASGNVKLVSPRGLALGLEKGNLFKQVIENHTETLSKGKTFIFYTDGFTEAMDKNEREFGLERIIEIVNKHSYESSKALLDILVNEVKKFIGKTHQHDDMTMVIVKVN